MTKITQVAVEKLVDDAIKHDLNNEKVVKNALTHSILLAAGDIGRFDALNRLFRGVSNSTAEGIRLFMVNLIEDTGIKVHDAETDKEKTIVFYTFTKKDGYNHVSKDKRGEIHKEHRAKVAAMSIDTLMAIPLGARKRETIDNLAEFTFQQFETRMGSLLKKAVSEGAINNAQFEQFNKLLSAGNRVDMEAVKEAEDKRIESARKFLEKQGLSVIATKEETSKVEHKQAKAA